jgi:hypothetical protein
LRRLATALLLLLSKQKSAEACSFRDCTSRFYPHPIPAIDDVGADSSVQTLGDDLGKSDFSGPALILSRPRPKTIEVLRFLLATVVKLTYNRFNQILRDGLWEEDDTNAEFKRKNGCARPLDIPFVARHQVPT